MAAEDRTSQDSAVIGDDLVEALGFEPITGDSVLADELELNTTEVAVLDDVALGMDEVIVVSDDDGLEFELHDDDLIEGSEPEDVVDLTEPAVEPFAAELSLGLDTDAVVDDAVSDMEVSEVAHLEASEEEVLLEDPDAYAATGGAVFFNNGIDAATEPLSSVVGDELADTDTETLESDTVVGLESDLVGNADLDDLNTDADGPVEFDDRADRVEAAAAIDPVDGVDSAGFDVDALGVDHLDEDVLDEEALDGPPPPGASDAIDLDASDLDASDLDLTEVTAVVGPLIDAPVVDAPDVDLTAAPLVTGPTVEQQTLVQPTSPAFDTEPAPSLVAVPSTGGRRQKLRARKSRRVVRHIDPWSVLTFSVLFHLCFFAALLLASVLVWNAALAAGTIENIENFVRELGDYETFEINSDQVFKAAALIAGILTLASSVLAVLLTVVFNLISDLIGGIRVTVIEEETVRIPKRSSK
ncbi:MAG: hypothetical protein ACI8TP_003290 [Acidimicrobiales bacterium]|jgi:hypothetical protein